MLRGQVPVEERLHIEALRLLVENAKLRKTLNEYSEGLLHVSIPPPPSRTHRHPTLQRFGEYPCYCKRERALYAALLRTSLSALSDVTWCNSNATRCIGSATRWYLSRCYLSSCLQPRARRLTRFSLLAPRTRCARWMWLREEGPTRAQAPSLAWCSPSSA